ncbi:MAG: (2Fe-2S) ferredoxin domain-containing protein [Cyanobacteria bacterium P01_F01_bin.86]
MAEFKQWVTPLNQGSQEVTPSDSTIEYEDFSSEIDVIGPLLYRLFQERWQDVQLGHMVEGSVLELSFTEAPELFVVYDGYLTVATKSWHMHLCVDENLGGPLCRTPVEQRQHRVIKRAALYCRTSKTGRAFGWGIQFWNGANERMMTLFLPSPYLGDDDDLLPEGKPRLEKLALYEELRSTYILGERPIPYEQNPLTRPYLAVCTSSRCNPSRNWQPTADALKAALSEQGLDIPVQTTGCLEVCKLGPVVFHSGDRTWFTRATPNIAKQIVEDYLVKGEAIPGHHYPANARAVQSKSTRQSVDVS